MKKSHRSLVRVAYALLVTSVLLMAPSADAQNFRECEWSDPEPLDGINSPTSFDSNATLSPNGLSLYFVTNRPNEATGPAVNTDIWVAQRRCVDCPWRTPQPLGASINTTSSEGGPSLSSDGRLLFFHSNRPGGKGDSDIYVSWRSDTHDDFAWEPAINVGEPVNSPNGEFSPDYVKIPEFPGSTATLYFGRGNAAAPGGAGNNQDIHRAPIMRTHDELSFGEPSAVTVLNSSFNDAAPSVRGDAKEILFWSPRSGSADIWVSTRLSVRDEWSSPQNLGPPISTSSTNERRPSLTESGRTVLFDRGDGAGTDIWQSTRRPGCQAGADQDENGE